GADDGADLVVQDLGRRSRERSEAGVAQPLEVRVERQLEGGSALPDLERREGVDVKPWHGVLDRPADVDVEVAGEGGMDPPLEADLRGAALPGLVAAAHDLIERDEVGRPAQVGGELALRERAEAAAEIADVRVVDVARDDV